MEVRQLLINKLFKKEVPIAYFFFLAYGISSSCHSNELTLLLGKQYFHYQEYSQSGVLLDTEAGWLNKLALQFETQLNSDHFIHTSGSFASATIPYKGYTQSGKNHSTQTRETLKSLNIEYYYVPLINASHLLGIGLHRNEWLREIQPKNSVLGLNEIYTWNATSFNYLFRYQAWQLKSSLSHLSSGNINVDLTEINKGTVNVPLKNGYQSELALSYKKQLTTNLSTSIIASGLWRYFPESNAVNAGNSQITEPQSELFQTSIDVGISYLF